MLNLNQLRAFYQVAKCQNVSLAAEQLFVSQPAVTAQVKLFEESCGLKLFKKKGRNLILSDEGITLFNYAKNIFEYEQKIEEAVAQMKELKKGNLRFFGCDDCPSEKPTAFTARPGLPGRSAKTGNQKNAIPGHRCSDGKNDCRANIMLCGPAKRFDLIHIGYRLPKARYEI